MTNDKMDRRSLLGIIAAGLGTIWALAAAGLSAVFVGSSVAQAGRSSEATLDELEALDDTFKAFTLTRGVRDGWYSQSSSQTVFARRNPDQPDQPVVLSATCTHLGCTVGWNESHGEFVCPCHGGRFDAEGRRKSGPPPSDLERLAARVEGTTVIVDLG